MLGMGLFDIYMAATVLGTGYVILSACLGHLDLGAGGDAEGDVTVGHGGDIGHDAGDLSSEIGYEGGDVAEHDTGVVADATDEQRRAFSAFSPTIVATFLGAFGVVGLVMQRGYGWHQVSLLPALGGGLVFAFGLMSIFNKLAAAACGSSHAQVRRLIGVAAEVITPIGADSPGDIAYTISGTRFTRSARSANGQPLRRGQRVTIEAIDGNDTYVLSSD